MENILGRELVGHGNSLVEELTCCTCVSKAELRFHRILRLEKTPKISNSKDIPEILHLPRWELIHCSLDKEQETFPSPQMPHSRVMGKAATIAGGSDVQVSSDKRLG